MKLIWLIRRALRKLSKAPDYISFVLEGELPELPPPKAGFIASKLQGKEKPPTLKELRGAFDQIAGDSRTKGIILHIRPLQAPLAHLQTLRDLIGDVRSKGKRVVAWSHSFTTANYFVATACDEILIQPGAIMSPMGVARSYPFLADSLARVGLQGDFVAISPYKSAADMFTRSNMSDEGRHMETWLIDSFYQDVVEGIAAGRKVDAAQAKSIIDNSPYTDVEAIDAKVVDGAVHEEDLPVHLAAGKPAKIELWKKARGRLLLLPKPKGGKYVALIRIEGDIVDGRSSRPPIPSPIPIPLVSGPRAGDMTLVQHVRKVIADKRAAAAVVFVESGGGSAVSSEAMARALEQLAAKKPLVVSMGWVAGSGGYWVATPAQWIVAQSGTYTGSIGVLSGKIVNASLFDKLLVNRETISRGENVEMNSARRAYNDHERKRTLDAINRIYDHFLDKVSSSRKLDRTAVHEMAGGRVWTGRQALQKRLIDQVGGLDAAITKAKQLSGLPANARVHDVKVKKSALPPRQDLAAALAYAWQGIEMINRSQALAVMPVTPQDRL